MFLAVFFFRLKSCYSIILSLEMKTYISNMNSYYENDYLIWQFHICYSDLPQSYYQFFIQMISKHFQV